jgi:hypothetical protein
MPSQKHLFILIRIFAAVLLGGSTVAWAQEENPSESACLSSQIVSVPSRPTVTNATEPTQCGVVEFEYGFDHQWLGAGDRHNDLSGGLRFGITPNLDFHWASASFLNVANGTGSQTGFGDTWLGLKYRFLRQTKHRPSLGLFYAAKAPSASYLRGLGSGQVDHSISFLASKDVRRFHFDFNVIQLLAGRPNAPGNDHNTGFALSTSYPLTHRLSVVAEPYGYTELNQDNPAFASVMAGFNCQLRHRLVLDTGFDAGVTAGAPKMRAFVGVTYAITNMYAWIKHAQ